MSESTPVEAAPTPEAAPAKKPPFRLFPAHAWWAVLIFFAALLGLRLLLGVAGQKQNTNLISHPNPATPYADLVEVKPDTGYFVTWGVTAAPRARELARTGTDDRYGDTYSQARQIFSTLQMDLAEVGLSLRDVVNVRAYIVGDGKEPPDFDGWNRAFKQFFGSWDNPHVPARTTVGITRLFNPDYRVEVEFTVAFPDDRGPFQQPGGWFENRYERLDRTETSENWMSYGRPSWVMSTGKATMPGQDLYFSAQLRPAPTNPDVPPMMQQFGTLDQQAESIFKQMSEILREAGLKYEDVFFMRTIVYPDPKTSIGRSFSAFNKVYAEYFNNEKVPNRPTRTLMSAPGLTGKKQYLSIEFYAAYPKPKEDAPLRETFGTAPSLATKDSMGGRGTRVGKDGQMLWLSGTVASIAADAPLDQQLASALEGVEKRLALAGGTKADITAVRAYLIYNQNPMVMHKAIETWEKFYQANLGEAAPAVTTLPVVALPGGYQVELEVQAVVPVKE